MAFSARPDARLPRGWARPWLAQVELARICWAEDDLDGFEAALQQALALTRHGGLDEGHATVLAGLGHVARERGEATLARQRAAEAARIFARTRPEGLCFCAELRALLARDAGEPRQAARWLGAREAPRRPSVVTPKLAAETMQARRSLRVALEDPRDVAPQGMNTPCTTTAPRV